MPLFILGNTYHCRMEFSFCSAFLVFTLVVVSVLVVVLSVVLVVLSVVCGIPFISPILGPGAVIQQIIGTLIGSQIAIGAIPVTMALPALFAISTQCGCDFIAVALSMSEAEPETVEIGVPAMLFSRLFTGPIGVIIGWIGSIGIFGL